MYDAIMLLRQAGLSTQATAQKMLQKKQLTLFGSHYQNVSSAGPFRLSTPITQLHIKHRSLLVYYSLFITKDAIYEA
jgi:hypothetical protein